MSPPKVSESLVQRSWSEINLGLVKQSLKGPIPDPRDDKFNKVTVLSKQKSKIKNLIREEPNKVDIGSRKHSSIKLRMKKFRKRQFSEDLNQDVVEISANPRADMVFNEYADNQEPANLHKKSYHSRKPSDVST